MYFTKYADTLVLQGRSGLLCQRDLSHVSQPAVEGLPDTERHRIWAGQHMLHCGRPAAVYQNELGQETNGE